MAQHFLLSTQARQLSLATIIRVSDGETFTASMGIRSAENDGEAVYPAAVRLMSTPTSRANAGLLWKNDPLIEHIDIIGSINGSFQPDSLEIHRIDL